MNALLKQANVEYYHEVPLTSPLTKTGNIFTSGLFSLSYMRDLTYRCIEMSC